MKKVLLVGLALVLVLGASLVSAQGFNYVTNPGFESGPNVGWWESSSHGYNLVYHHLDSPQYPHSGGWLAWLGGDDNETSILSQYVSIPSTNPELTFWWRTDTKDADYGNDKWQIHVGGVIVGSYKMWPGTSEWRKFTIDLHNFAGISTWIGFHAITDGVGTSSFYLDDVSVHAGNPPPTFTPAPTNTPVPTSTPVPTGLANGNFEQGHIAWDEFSTLGYDLIYQDFALPSHVTPHGGIWAAWLGGNDGEEGRIEQQVRLPSNNPHLKYWYWVDSSDYPEYDFMKVIINTTVVDQFDLCESTHTDGWVERTVNLSSYAGQVVTLYFYVYTDSTITSSLFLDDISIYSPSAPTPTPTPTPPEYFLYLPYISKGR